MKIFFHLCVQFRKIWLQVCSQIWKKIALTEIFTVMWSKTSVLSIKTEENDIQSSEQCLRWFPTAAAIYFCFYWNICLKFNVHNMANK